MQSDSVSAHSYTQKNQLLGGSGKQNIEEIQISGGICMDDGECRFRLILAPAVSLTGSFSHSRSSLIVLLIRETETVPEFPPSDLTSGNWRRTPFTMGDYSSPVPTSTEYWRDYLDGIEPCYFPALNNARLRNHESEVGSVEIPADRTAIQSFCVLSGCSEQILFKTAWALILRCYTGQERPCFGFLSTKGTPVPNWVLLADTDPLGKILAALELDAFDQRMNECPSEGLAMDADHDNLPLFNTALADSGDAMSLLLSLKVGAMRACPVPD